MHGSLRLFSLVIFSWAGTLGIFSFSAHGQANAYRGLWVGEVQLNAVNEVSVPLDENNVPIAPNPNNPTPTFDRASLFLILHVNGAGQVSLLKDAAILNRAPVDGDGLQSTLDLALVTDESLYDDFPVQPAQRVASAVFDFGDARATDALNAMVDAAAQAAANNLSSESASQSAALTGAQAVIDNADVAASFDQFLSDFLDPASLQAITDAIAGGGTSQELTDAEAAAAALRDASFYEDTRGIDILDAIEEAVLNATPGSEDAAANQAAAAFSDVNSAYNRFLAGGAFSTMINAAVTAAATARVNSEDVRDAVEALAEVTAARTEAIQVSVQPYDDDRAADAVEQILDVIVNTATNSTTSASTSLLEIELFQAVEQELADNVLRSPELTQTPSGDYTEFVRSSSFQNSASVAANAAGTAAFDENENNPFSNSTSIFNAAKLAAINALQVEYATAARAELNSLPMSGSFAPGESGLTATLSLPANFPTNPFRHRRHPDHTTGFDISRVITIDFDAEATQLDVTGYGVQQITGTYREEVSGLHKPLGPDSDIGLKVEGTFTLNRISFIDALNAR